MLDVRKFRVLIVDDELEMLAGIAGLLRTRTDLEVFTAQTADQAIELLPGVDAVIADCVFPDSERFNRLADRSGKPIIRMSGLVANTVNLELSKPFTKQQLRDSVELLRFLHSGSGPRDLRRA